MRDGQSWDEASVEDVAWFVAWLRAPAGNVIVLADGSGPGARRRSTVTWPGSSASTTTMRTGLGVAAELVSWRRISCGSGAA
ncbi:MAG TPA: hypothetical protein VLW50_12605 [Streptosporangiaceae bacterium]|nr:hypothetical protein [Streptosporangiaceae bacterium]